MSTSQPLFGHYKGLDKLLTRLPKLFKSRRSGKWENGTGKWAATGTKIGCGTVEMEM